MTATFGYIQSEDAANADYAGVKAGTDGLAVFDSSQVLGHNPFVGQEFNSTNANGYISYLTFLTYDTSGLTVAPDSAQLNLVIGENNLTAGGANNFVIKVAAYDYGSTLDTTDWLTPTDLSALTVIGSFDPTGLGGPSPGNNPITIDLDPTAIALAGTTRLVMFTDRQAAGSDPLTGAPGAYVEYVMFYNYALLLVTKQNKSTVTHSSYSSEVMADSPELYWRLDELSGTVAADSSGHSHTGTYVGTPTLGATSLLGGDANKAVSFIGDPSDASWVRTNTGFGGGATPITLTTFSLEGILKPTAIVTYANLCGFEQDGNQGPFGTEVDLEYYSDGAATPTNQMAFYQANATQSLHNTGFPIALNVPTHFVAVYDHGAGLYTLYINGDGYSLFDPNGIGDPPILDANRFYAGGDSYTGDTVAGTVDETAYYTQALSRTRVLKHYYATLSPDATVASSPVNVTVTIPAPFVNAMVVSPSAVNVVTTIPAMTFRGDAIAAPAAVTVLTVIPEESETYRREVLSDSPTIYLRCGDATSPLLDSSGHGHNMITSGGMTLDVPGLQNSDSDGAIFIDGTFPLEDDSHDWQPGPYPAQYTAGAFTFETIVKLTSYDDGMLVGFINEGLNVTATGNVFASFYDTGNILRTTANFSLPLNNPFHLAATFDGSSGNLKLYVNGDLKAMAATGATGWELTSWPSTFIGFFPYHNLLAGTQDEIAWYPTALSAFRIHKHYLAAKISGDITSIPATVNAPVRFPALAQLPNTTVGPAATSVVVRMPRPIAGPPAVHHAQPGTFLPTK